MRKIGIVIVVLIAAAGAVFYVANRRGRGVDPRVRLVQDADPKAVILTCVYCGHRFALSEGRPVPGRRDVVACPHCRRPTPIQTLPQSRPAR